MTICHTINWGAPQVVYTSSPYMMPGAASISAIPMTSYTTGMPMTYSTWDARDVLWSNLGLNSTQNNLFYQLAVDISRSYNNSRQKISSLLVPSTRITALCTLTFCRASFKPQDFFQVSWGKSVSFGSLELTWSGSFWLQETKVWTPKAFSSSGKWPKVQCFELF